MCSSDLLLYGEGYTIKGVQRILKEHGVKSVQGLADSSAAVSFGALEETLGQALMEEEPIEEAEVTSEDEEEEASDEEGIDFRFVDTEDDILDTFRVGPPQRAGIRSEDREKLEGVLKELVDCRALLDRAMKDV